MDEAPRYWKIDGAQLEYHWTGPPPHTAPTLVLLHEGLGCAALWKEFPARLSAATDCGVLAYSRQGYGGSDAVALPRPLDYLEDEALRVLPAVLDAAGIQRALLVGHSDGASIALVHSGGRRDPRVRGQVLMAPHVFNEDLSVRGIRATQDAYEHGELRARLARWHGDNVDGAFYGWSEAWLHPDFAHWNIEKYLSHITVPSVVIQGEDDPYGSVAQVEAIRRQVKGTVRVLMLPDCGHAPFREQPAPTQDAIVTLAAQQFDVAAAGH